MSWASSPDAIVMDDTPMGVPWRDREGTAGNGIENDTEQREVLRRALHTYLGGEVGRLSLGDDLAADRHRRNGEKGIIELETMTQD